MTIPHSLAHIIRKTGSLRDLLDKTVELVAREMDMDVCSIYLLESGDSRLRLVSTHGLDQEAMAEVVLERGEGITGIVVNEMRSIAVPDASAHPGYHHFPGLGEEKFHSYLGVPLAIRTRPVGAIVVQSREQRDFSRDEIQTLNTISAQLVGVVENARLVHALDQPDTARRYISELRRWNTGNGSPKSRRGEIRLEGHPASGGIATGEVIFRGSFEIPEEIRSRPAKGPDDEIATLNAAVEKTRTDILRTQEAATREADEEHALIFSSHLLLLNDPVIQERLLDAIRQNALAAPLAVESVFQDIADQIASVSDVYLQERAEDFRDLQDRILWHLVEDGLPFEGISNKIVVAQGIPPSLVVEMKVQGARALVTERGGSTSHGTLLARSMGIPAVTGVKDLVLRVRSGDKVIVDGDRGKVVVRPRARTRESYCDRAAKQASIQLELQKNSDLPATSVDDVSVELLANIGIASELRQAVKFGAQGVGLYRTEFLFMIREDFPTPEDQARVFGRACEAFPKGPVLFRILDLGGDKFHPRISSPDEANPVLGYRSLRMLLDQPALLEGQVEAFLRAAAGRPFGIIVPMVSAVDEFVRVREIIVDAVKSRGPRAGLENPDFDEKNLSIGVMVEVPSATEIIPDLARHADFFSIGSNDLIQFTLATDRENARVASHASPYHPAILRMIRRCVRDAHVAGKKISVCGEMASIPEIAVLLVAMGIDSLSLIPGAIPGVKEAVRCNRILKFRERLDELVGLSDAQAVQDAIKKIFTPFAPGSSKRKKR